MSDANSVAAQAVSTRVKRVAVIERFRAVSRHCPTDGHDIEAHVVRLRDAGDPRRNRRENIPEDVARLPALIGRCVRSLAGVLAQRGLSARDKTALVASALMTQGAPAESLASLNDIIQLLRSHEFDRIDCFSMRGFAMVSTLSRVFGVPHREFLSRGTRYFGEFAFELQTVIPYAYWLHRNGLLEVTQACADTKCLYYFSRSMKNSGITVPMFPPVSIRPPADHLSGSMHITSLNISTQVRGNRRPTEQPSETKHFVGRRNSA